MKFLLSFIVLSSILFFNGCGKEKVIEEDKFVVIYADLLIAGDTTSVDKAREIVFDRHKINKTQYEETVKYYNDNPTEWDGFFNKVITHIESERKKLSSPSP